jgi:formiminoglutamase
MNDISIYFQPLQGIVHSNEDALGKRIQYHTENAFPELEKGAIALIYCPEFRNGAPEFHQQSDDSFRTSFAKLYPTANWNFEIADLGNLLPGERIEDTYFALKQVVAELVKKSILPIIIGGTQDLTFPLYQGYQQLEQTINMAAIDYRFDLGSPEEPVSKDGYLSQILMHRPCYLFNHSTIGIQAPYVKQEEFDLFEKLYFDTCRLGEFNADFRIAEPYLRNADLLSIDLQAIRKSDISGPNYQQPNGFYADQVCQIAKYAGISDKLTSLGIFNFFPTNLGQDTHELVAQLIWYFLDGVSQRKGDFPFGTKKDYLKFMVHLVGTEKELVFYKSNKSERWWMEVPYPPKQGVKFERHHMVPCNYEDYELAMKNEMPDLWWKTYQKLS